MNECPKCGCKFSDRLDLCPMCGYPIPPPCEFTDQQVAKSGVLLVCLVVACVTLVLAYVACPGEIG